MQLQSQRPQTRGPRPGQLKYAKIAESETDGNS